MEVAPAREQFAVIMAQLRSAAMFGMEHGEVERLVSRKGTELLRRLLQAHSAGMRRSATLRDLSQDQRKEVDTCADYLLKYHEILRYDRYLAEGFPIATGVIEGACRQLVKTAWTSPGHAGASAAPRRC